MSHLVPSRVSAARMLAAVAVLVTVFSALLAVQASSAEAARGAVLDGPATLPTRELE